MQDQSRIEKKSKIFTSFFDDCLIYAAAEMVPAIPPANHYIENFIQTSSRTTQETHFTPKKNQLITNLA